MVDDGMPAFAAMRGRVLAVGDFDEDGFDELALVAREAGTLLILKILVDGEAVRLWSQELDFEAYDIETIAHTDNGFTNLILTSNKSIWLLRGRGDGTFDQPKLVRWTGSSASKGIGEPSVIIQTSDIRLTKRERVVVDLASANFTCREIAERLCLSRRTVEGHLARAMNKMGVTRKRELAMQVGERR